MLFWSRLNFQWQKTSRFVNLQNDSRKMILPGSVPAKGRILVSQPALTDKFFGRAVVLLAEHGIEGSFGLIINKPAKIKLSKVVNEQLPFDSDLYLGGPVSVDNLFFVHSKGKLMHASLKIINGVYWGGNQLELKNLMAEGKITGDDIRFYAGYSGWQPKQLEREMNENSWIVLEAEKEFIFDPNPEDLWKRIVLRLGDEYAHWINYPPDPTMN